MLNKKTRWMAMGVALVLFAAAPVYADIIAFPGEASDDDVPLDYLPALIAYSYDDGTGVFTMEVYNLTGDPYGYTMSEIFFNVSDDVATISLLDNAGFTNASLDSGENAGGFGEFDWQLDLGRGNSGLESADPPPSMATFTFSVTGLDLTTADFFAGLTQNGDHLPAVGAIKYTQGGTADDSAYIIPGTPGDPNDPNDPVPEPATVVLLGLGLGAWALKKRS